MKRLSSTYVAAGLLVIAATALYLFTLDNGLRPDELTGGDLITHQYAQVEARPSNAPGYPLYTMGGWLWFRVGTLLLAGPVPVPTVGTSVGGVLNTSVICIEI